MLGVFALTAPAGASSGSDDPPPLVEHESPIIVETAALVTAFEGTESPTTADYNSHDVSPEVQEAMEAHAAELRETAADARTEAATDLPTGNVASSSGGIAVTYNADHSAPTAVRTAVNAAVAEWDSLLQTNPSGPVVIEVFWSNLGDPSLLGYAGPDGMYYGGGLPTNSLYSAALANTLLGLDANGSSRPEVQVVLNAELLASNRWYLGMAGTPAGSQIDLYSVALHEIGHGLGFLGSASIGKGESAPSLNSTPYAYDDAATYNGAPIVNASNQGAALQSGNVHINISSSTTFKLHAPSTWAQGSSFSHFDESSYQPGSPGALMTPILSGGETARDVDAATLGVMAYTGWPTTVRAVTPTITNVSTSQTAVGVSWNANLGGTGLAPGSYRIDARRNGVVQSSVTVSGTATSAIVGSLTPGQNYTLIVTPIGFGGAGAVAWTSASLKSGQSTEPTGPAAWPSYIRDVPLDGQINRLYQAYFLRLPDEDGFEYWVDQRARSTSLNNISSAFASGNEFKNRYGSLNNSAFVDLVYLNVLGRSPDPDGRAYWIGQLNQGVDRGAVMAGFAESNEYVNRTQTQAATSVTQARISRLYMAFFLRDPDPAGLAYWSGQANNGTSLEAIASSFAQSSEFKNRYRSLTNQQFVTLVYNNVLGRSPDPAGLAHWVGVLNGGVDRGTVMVGFSESVEFIKSTGTIP